MWLVLLFACVPALVPPGILDNPAHDFDGDGFTEEEGDCDDAEAAAGPGGDEVCGDGVDNDCDGTPGDCAPHGTTVVTDVGFAVTVGEDFGDGGWSVGALPDIDENGASELLVGIPGFHTESDDGTIVDDVGTLLVVEGPRDNNVRLVSGSWQPAFEQAARFGSVVGAAGDFDGDGRVDAFCAGPDYVGGVVGVFTNPLRNGTWVYAESEVEGDELGAAVAAVGDVNEDGMADLLAGAPGAGGDDGALVLVEGTEGAVPNMSTIAGGPSGQRVGAAVAGPGDLDGDGVVDFLAGAPERARGAVYIVPGPFPADIEIAEVAVRIDGVADGDRAGAALVGVGDVDGDGLPDFAVGAPAADGGAGAVYIVRSPPAEGDLSAAWATLSGAADEGAGSSLHASADYDGEGTVDLVIGAPLADAGTGAVYLFGALAPGAVATTDALLTLLGVDAGDAFGTSVGPAGDLDGDGAADLAIGAPYVTDDSRSVGRTYVVLGGPGY